MFLNREQNEINIAIMEIDEGVKRREISLVRERQTGPISRCSEVLRNSAILPEDLTLSKKVAKKWLSVPPNIH